MKLIAGPREAQPEMFTTTARLTQDCGVYGSRLLVAAQAGDEVLVKLFYIDEHEELWQVVSPSKCGGMIVPSALLNFDLP